ncbi:MAG: [citrate (pro-3S)-lyase] ligase [Clostridium sp.]
MSDYHISQIFFDNKREMKQLDALLEKEGIERDKNLDYTIGLYDEDYTLAATGSCFGNTLRCMAVDSHYQGEGLLNQVVSHLIDYEYSRSMIDLFLYTKCDKAFFFKDLGFYEIARVDGKVVFMENRKQGFSGYLENLRKETELQVMNRKMILTPDTLTGAVIMNANPFTLGHLYLLEQASAACGLLHVFVVSEDRSAVPFEVRFNLVKKGSAHLKNLVFHQTGNYMISNATFPSYFLKDVDTIIRSHAGLDITIFTQIAKSLGIAARFVGEEPLSQVTAIYNQVMTAELKHAGIDCIVIPRKTNTNNTDVISASAVRSLIHQGAIGSIKELVPESTYEYFTSPESQPVIQAIQAEADVIHH